jgi:cytoskeleton protein RodZ
MSDVRDGEVLNAHEPNATEEVMVTPEDGAVKAGDLLRAAREASGLHIAALAVSLKVPVRKLEALETNQFHELPDAVFVRALAASVCRSLKIDSGPILQLLPASNAPRLVRDNGGLNAPFRSSGDVAAQTRFGQLSRPMLIAVLVLLFGALLLIFLPTAKTGAGRTTEDVVSVPLTQATEPLATPSTPVEPAVAGTPLASADVPMAAPALGNASAAVAMPAAVATPATTPATTAAAASGLVVFLAKGESWVEVVDGKGVPTLRRLLVAGESVGVNGALPLQVVVGRADVTSVMVRGKAFDLAPVSFENVARFEVK